VADKTLIILAALDLESRAIAKSLGIDRRTGQRPADSAGRNPLALYTVGIRAKHLPRGWSRRTACGVVMAGLAGALDPTLKVGEVVIDGELAGDFHGVIFRSGKIVASDKLISTPEEKAKLFSKTGALAVDMESAAARKMALAADLPFISIRAISDTASQTLDPSTMAMVDEFGRPKISSIVLSLSRRPQLVGQLQRMGRSAALAAANLAAALKALTDSGALAWVGGAEDEV
jgi:adenosylhomocysteine nucleosidase